jgi:4-hydroxybenzoate polyprenyltransferase
MVKKTLHIISESNLFTALCAAQFYLYYAKLFQAPISTPLLASIFIGTLISYSLVQWPENFFQQPLNFVPKIFIALTAVLFFLLFFISWQNSLIFAHLLVIVVLYESPVLKRNNMRRIPYIKPFIISYVWAVIGIVFFAPHFDLFALLLFIDAFIFIFSLTLLFDLRDIQCDKNNQLQTIAGVLGSKQLKILSTALFLIHLAIEYFLTAKTGGLYLLPIFLFLIFFARINGPRYYFILGVDSLIFLRPFIL